MSSLVKVEINVCICMASVFRSQPLGCSVGLQESSTNTNLLQSPHNDSIRIIFISRHFSSQQYVTLYVAL